MIGVLAKQGHKGLAGVPGPLSGVALLLKTLLRTLTGAWGVGSGSLARVSGKSVAGIWAAPTGILPRVVALLRTGMSAFTGLAALTGGSQPLILRGPVIGMPRANAIIEMPRGNAIIEMPRGNAIIEMQRSG
jgi:hypothetical protein